MFHTHTHSEAKQVIRVVYTKSNNKTLFIFKKKIIIMMYNNFYSQFILFHTNFFFINIEYHTK